MCARVVVVVLGSALVLAACEDAPTATLSLCWTFSDGRSCADSGVERVVARPTDARSSEPLLLDVSCYEGFGAQSRTLTVETRVPGLDIQARSAADSPLYRASLPLSLGPNEQARRCVELFFTGGL